MHEPPDSERDRSPSPRSDQDRETVIDVSSDEPEIVGEERAGSGFSNVRVYVAQGGAKTCLIPVGLFLLLLCCACIGFWAVTDNLF